MRAAIAVWLLGAGLLAATADAAPPATRPVTGLHFASNSDPGAKAIGVNVWDIGPDGVAGVPAGEQGLIYVGGDYDGCAPLVPESRFQAAVRQHAGNPKVFGWYLWDEPNLGACPQLADQIRARARFVKQHAGGQRTFLVGGGGNGEPVPAALAPRPLPGGGVDIDLYGVDPYPCLIGQARCNYGLIAKAVDGSLANGVPRAALVPVYQGFGQEGCGATIQRWRKPSAAELEAMFVEWNRLLPTPVFDIVYSWGKQAVTCQVVANDPELQAVFRKRFVG